MPDGPGTFAFGRGERKRRRRGRKGPGPFSSSPPPLHTPPAFPHPPTDPTSSWASPCGKSSENPVFPIISQHKPHPRLPSLAPKKRGCCGMPPRRRAPFRGCDFQPHPVQEAARGLPPPWAMRLPAASPQPRFSPPFFLRPIGSGTITCTIVHKHLAFTESPCNNPCRTEGTNHEKDH